MRSGTEPEPSIADAVCAIVYAAPRTELKELQVLREILMYKVCLLVSFQTHGIDGRQYGRTFAKALQATDPPPESVPARIVSKLALYSPGQELVDAYLYEIARGYGVAWAPDPGPGDIQADEGKEGDDVADVVDDKKGDGDGGGPGEGQQKEPVAVLETSKDTGLSMPRAPTYPAGQEKDAWSGGEAGVPPIEGGKKLTEEEELAKRFERLKNLR